MIKPKTITAALAVLCACACARVLCAAASPAATQAWVIDYVQKIGGGTNGVMSVDIGGGDAMTATFEMLSERALIATNCNASASAPIADGTLFAYVGDGVYRNGIIGEEIVATRTNFVWRTIGSVSSEGFDRFGDAFSVAGFRITPSKKEELK